MISKMRAVAITTLLVRAQEAARLARATNDTDERVMQLAKVRLAIEAACGLMDEQLAAEAAQ